MQARNHRTNGTNGVFHYLLARFSPGLAIAMNQAIEMASTQNHKERVIPWHDYLRYLETGT